MKASGSISIFDATDDVLLSATAPQNKVVGMLWLDTTANILKRWNGSAWASVIADEVRTSSVSVTAEGIVLHTTGTMTIESGATFHLTAGSAAGEHMGLSSDGALAFFSGADTGSGDNAKCAISNMGELTAVGASISGAVSVDGSMNFGSDIAVTFENEAARGALFAALMRGNAVTPYQLGGTNADSRAGALSNFGLLSGDGEPSGVTARAIGDRYLLTQASTVIADNTAQRTLTGYSCTRTSQQRRLKTVKTYVYLSGTRPDLVPSNTTTYGSWGDTGTPSDGTIEPTDAAYCYVASGTVTGSYSGAVTTTKSQGSTGIASDLYVVWTLTTKTNYEYRTYTKNIYWSVCAAPVASDFNATAVRSLLCSLTRSVTTSLSYSLYQSTSADGQEGRLLLGTVTTTDTNLAFDISDYASYYQGGTYYLSLERNGATSSSAVPVSDAEFAFRYYGGENRAEEYAWNGAEWACIANANPYVHFPFYNAAEMTISASVTSGGTVANLIDPNTTSVWYATYPTNANVIVTVSLPVALTQITLVLRNRGTTGNFPEYVMLNARRGGSGVATKLSNKVCDLTSNMAYNAQHFIRLANNEPIDSIDIAFIKGAMTTVGLGKICVYGYLAGASGDTLII